MYDSTKPYKDRIIESIKETWNTPYVNVKDGKVYKKTFYPEYHHTDGIGTKGVYHWQQRTFENAVLDALAMNLNDLAMERSWPYAIVDHLFVPEDDHEAILDIIDYLSGECLKRDIAITGGETAIHNNMEGMELSINMLGLTENKKINQLEAGDYLIGFESSGLHSNGFTVVRELFNEYRKDFTKPTNIYIDEILRLNKNKKKTDKPVILNERSTVEDVCKRLHKDFFRYFKFAKISGPSAKFNWERVGLEHKLKDGDIVEIHMKK